jgi:hypothetical protein
MSFSRYNPEDQVVSSETVVRGLWSGDSNILPTIVTASGGSEYYVNVVDTSTPANIQFSVQYGNLSGSNSPLINPLVSGSSASRVVYGEWRNLIYGTESNNFVFTGSTVSADIFVVSIARSRYKESIQPGSIELTINSKVLIDDSSTTSVSRFIGENRYYNLIQSGSASTATYGFLFPDLGAIIMPLSTTGISLGSSGNNIKLFDAIKAGNNFKLQSAETVSSTYFFTRVKNSEFNYTTNPSIIDDNGNLLYTTLINSPQTFPTTIGLYNDNNELLAVAKMSRPLTKDFTKEALIRVKIDY